MTAALITPAPFALLTGETLWRLDSGDLVTVRILAKPSPDGLFLPFVVDGRQLNEDGTPRTVQGPFDTAPGPVTLPLACHSIQNAALANGVTTITDALTRYTQAALEQWAGYLAAHAAILNLPRATP